MNINDIAVRVAFNKIAAENATVGDLKKAVQLLKEVSKEKKDTKISDLLSKYSKSGAEAGVNLALKLLFGLFPGGGTVKTIFDVLMKISGKDPVKSLLSGLFKQVGMIPDAQAEKNLLAEKFDINDNYVKMIKDELIDEFINQFMTELDNLPDGDPVPDSDEAFEEFIAEKFKTHGVFSVED